MVYAIIAAVAVAILGAFFWWRRRQAAGDHQMLSFVGILRNPQALTVQDVSDAARRAWDADLGDGGEEEGKDGFVVGGEEGMPTMVLNYRGRMMIVNNFPIPYVDDPDAAANDIPDLRMQELVRSHTAWISVDAMGVESFEDIEEVREWYRLLGPMLSELVDENCLAILLPQTGQVFPNMDETLEMLKSDDPLEALAEDAPVPIIPIKEDDPRMKAAVKEARDNWPTFVNAFRQGNGENFAIKAPISGGGNTEFIWITVTRIENGQVTGNLANEPMGLGKLKLGSEVSAPEAEINDWAFFQGEEACGMYTVKVVTDAANNGE